MIQLNNILTIVVKLRRILCIGSMAIQSVIRKMSNNNRIPTMSNKWVSFNIWNDKKKNMYCIYLMSYSQVCWKKTYMLGRHCLNKLAGKLDLCMSLNITKSLTSKESWKNWTYLTYNVHCSRIIPFYFYYKTIWGILYIAPRITEYVWIYSRLIILFQSSDK